MWEYLASPSLVQKILLVLAAVVVLRLAISSQTRLFAGSYAPNQRPMIRVIVMATPDRLSFLEEAERTWLQDWDPDRVFIVGDRDSNQEIVPFPASVLHSQRRFLYPSYLRTIPSSRDSAQLFHRWFFAAVEILRMHPDTEWVLRVCDDTYVVKENLEASLHGVDFRAMSFMGQASITYPQGAKWPVKHKEDVELFSALHPGGGAGWLVSRRLVEWMSVNPQTVDANTHLMMFNDDVFSGYFFLKEAGVVMKNHAGFVQEPRSLENDLKTLSHCPRDLPLYQLSPLSDWGPIMPMFPTRWPDLSVFHTSSPSMFRALRDVATYKERHRVRFSISPMDQPIVQLHGSNFTLCLE
eukprot:ANDGO_01911.mRNA.1 hypothetical protein